jgi:hypothetical protein
MKLKLKALFISCALLLLATPAAAEKTKLLGTLSPAKNSVLKVMTKAGCQEGWLGQVLKDSKIKPSHVRNLPVGRKVYFRGSCKAEPPNTVKATSHTIALRDARVGTILTLKKEVATLQQKRNIADKQLKETATENTRLSNALLNLSESLTPKAPVTIVPPRKMESTAILVGAIASVLTLAAVIFGLVLRQKSEKPKVDDPNLASFKRNWPEEIDGKTWNFQLVAVEPEPGTTNLLGRYKCPECSERNIFGRKQNFLIHARTKHRDENL